MGIIMNYQSFPITEEMRKDLEAFVEGAIKVIYESLKRDTYLLKDDMSLSYSDDLQKAIVQRDEARYVARRLYKRLCDEHVKRIVAEAVYPYWAKKGPELADEIEILRAELARLKGQLPPPKGTLNGYTVDEMNDMED